MKPPKRPLNQLLLNGVARRVFQAADGILHFAFGLVSFALGLQLGVAHHLANRLLYRTLDLFRRSLDTILVHDSLLCKSAKRPRLHVSQSSRRLHELDTATIAVGH